MKYVYLKKSMVEIYDGENSGLFFNQVLYQVRTVVLCSRFIKCRYAVDAM